VRFHILAGWINGNNARIRKFTNGPASARVITQLVPFGLGQDAEECWIAVRYPMAEGKAANEDGDTGWN
jgi:hypothetical protein